MPNDQLTGMDAVAASLIQEGPPPEPELEARQPPASNRRQAPPSDEDEADTTDFYSEEEDEEDLDEAQDVEEEDEEVPDEDYSEEPEEGEEYEEDDDYDSEPQELEFDDDVVIPTTVDGEQVEVTLRDLKKTYALAGATQNRLREATQARQKAIEQAQINHDYTMKMVAAVADVLFQPTVPMPDPALMTTNFQAYQYQKELYDIEQHQIEQRKHGIANHMQQLEDQITNQKNEYRREQQRQLFEAFPGLKDPNKAERFEKEIFSFAKDTYGIDEQLLSTIDNHLAFVVLYDAMRLHKILQKKTIQPKKTKARAVTRRAENISNSPRADNTSERRRERRATEKARKTGKPDDVAASLIVRKRR